MRRDIKYIAISITIICLAVGAIYSILKLVASKL
jgi:hypothetical protein